MSDGTDSDSPEYATLFERFAGQFGDNIFLAITLVPIAIFPRQLAFGYLSLWALFLLFYVFVLEGIWSNQTVGKYIIRMKVAKDDGSPIGIRHSLIRNAIGLIGQVFGWLGLLVGAFAIWQSDQNKRLGDSVAGTVVIKVDSRAEESE